MSINIIDNFRVGTSKPLDDRTVVGQGERYTDKESIELKYTGLRVWDKSENKTFIWNGANWIAESGGGSEGASLPIGSIILWYNLSGNLPAGFFLCDGKTYTINGTTITTPNIPNLGNEGGDEFARYIIYLSSDAVDVQGTTTTTTTIPGTTTTTTQAVTQTPTTDFDSKTEDSLTFLIVNTLDDSSVDVTWELRKDTILGGLTASGVVENIQPGTTQSVLIEGLDEGTTYHFTNIIATADDKLQSQPGVPRQGTTFFKFTMTSSGTSSQSLSCGVNLEAGNTADYWHDGFTPYPLTSSVIYEIPNGNVLDGDDKWFKFNNGVSDISIQIDESGLVVDLKECLSLRSFVMSEEGEDIVGDSCNTSIPYTGATATFYHSGELEYPNLIASPDEVVVYVDEFGGIPLNGGNKWFIFYDGENNISIQINPEGKVVGKKQCFRTFDTTNGGFSTDVDACNTQVTLDINRYHDGIFATPSMGNTIYTLQVDGQFFNGGDEWYKITTDRSTFYAIQIDGTGEVINIEAC